MLSIESALDVFQEKKRMRIAYMVYELLERGGEADLKEFMGSLSVNYGFRGKTLEEYFDDLKNAKMVKIGNRKISLLWDKDQTKEWLENKGVITVRKEDKRRQCCSK